jgi:predicted TPR repeat methyltransferase
LPVGDPLLQDAKRLHESGRLDEAARLYRHILRQCPTHIEARYRLGMALAQAGRLEDGERMLQSATDANPNFTEGWRARGVMLMHLARRHEALACFDRMVALAPLDAEGWNGRGGVLAGLGRREEALASFERAAAAAPASVEALCNRATMLFELQRFQEALDGFDALLKIAPELAIGWNNRGNALAKMGRFEEAASSYYRALALKPDFAEAKENRDFALFSLGRTVRSPAKYLRGLFDGFAGHYDDTMLNALSYRAHEHVRALAERVLPKTNGWRILDLGCGTGLVATQFKDLATGGRLDGVDIAPKMIEAARVRGLYDDLILGDLETVLAEDGRFYDLILSADTLTYFGELAPVFAGIAKRLEPGGFCLFASEAKTGSGWEETKVHRFRHSEAYLREAATAAGFAVIEVASGTLRREENEPVIGFLVALRKAP